jgi:ABC-type proline/glycine betaine transport system ATPase subunit
MDQVVGGLSEKVADKTVNMNERIDKIAEYVLGTNLPVAVVDDDLNIVGVMHQDHVLQILFPESQGEAVA